MGDLSSVLAGTSIPADWRQTDAVFLQKFLGRILPAGEVNSACEKLLAEFGSIGDLFRATRNEITRRCNAPEPVLDEIENTRSLLKAILRSGIADRPVCAAPEQLIDLCRMITASDRREQFDVVFLDKSKRFLGHECLQTGTVDHVTVYPREIMVLALGYSASHLVLVHNHPSGNAKPSRSDLEMTRQLQQACGYFGLTIHDHVIIGNTGNFSFREEGLLDRDPGYLIPLPLQEWPSAGGR